MAGRRGSPGLSIGQLIVLTFGFLVASVLIFGFGWWVGFDVAEQRLAREQPIVRLTAQTMTPLPTALATPTRPEPAGPTVTPMAGRGVAASATPYIPPTATRVAPSPTAARATPTTAKASVAPTASALSGPKTWSVQVISTTDAVQAAMLVHRLRQKGLDAYPVTASIQDTMWYRVRIGRYKDRAQAQDMERRLKQEEGLPAAFVTEQ